MKIHHYILIATMLGSIAWAQVDYAIIPGTASVNTPYGPGLRAHQNFSATITVANQSINSGIPVTSAIHYELVPNFGGPFLPPTRLRWRLAEASPLLIADRGLPELAAAQTNFVLTTILNPPPGITPGNYSLRAVLDPDHLQDDALRANNTNILHGNLTVLATADLRVDSVLLPDGEDTSLYANGESVTVRVRYENVGQSTVVPPFPVDYFLMPPGYFNLVVLGNAADGFSYDITDWQPWDYPDQRIFLGRRTAPGVNPGEGVIDFDQVFTLPSMPLGSFPEWVIGAVVNPDGRAWIQTNLVMEMTYTNNRAYTKGSANRIRYAHLAGQGADLRVRDGSLFISASSIAVGDAILVTGIVENAGNQPSSVPTTMNHYLIPINPDTQWSLPGSYLLGVSPVPALPAATILPPAVPVHSWSAQLTVPPTVPSGTYRYQVVVDPTDVIPETNTINNARSPASFPITVDGQSGLVNLLTSHTFTNNGVSPWTITNKSAFTATIEVWNAGPEPAGPFSVQFSLQSLSGTASNPIVGAPVPIGTLSVPQGLPGSQGFIPAKTNLTALLNVPTSDLIPPGRYRLFWEVDFLDDVLEYDPDDNTGFWGWLTGPASDRLVVVDAEAGLLPDLVPTDTSFAPEVIGVGKDLALVTFTNRLENPGTAVSPLFTYQLYLAAGPYPDTTNLILLASRPVAPIPVGDRADDVVTVSLPETLPVGTYYPVLIIDGNGNVMELDKSNNMIFFGDRPLYVTAQEATERPVLDIQDFTHGPTDLIPGQALDYQFTLVNNGDCALAGLMVDVGLNYTGQFQLGPFDPVLVEHGPFEIPGQGGEVEVRGSLVFDEPTLEGYAHRVIWAFNRRDPGVDTVNGDVYIARDVTVRELSPRVSLLTGGYVGGGPVVYVAFFDSSPGRAYQVQRSSDLMLNNGGFDTLNWTFPPGNPSTVLTYGPFNLLIEPGNWGYYRVMDVTPQLD